MDNCSDWRKPNGLKDDRHGIILSNGVKSSRVVRKKRYGVLVTSRREEYSLFAREYLTPLAATVFSDRVDRMVERELAK